MIDNPDYKGPWSPRKIANPDFYEDKTPLKNLAAIMGVGIELWTMQNDMMFDNIYVGNSFADAKKLAEESWAVKHKIEEATAEADDAKEEAEKKADATEKKDGAAAAAKADGFMESATKQLEGFLGIVGTDPVRAVKTFPSIAALLVSLLLLPLTFLIPGGSKEVCHLVVVNIEFILGQEDYQEG
jgi:calnexin